MSDSANRPSADEELESLLRQWRTWQDAQPQPSLYGRVHARLVGEAAVERQPLRTWLRWPSYAALLGIVLLLSGDGAALRSSEPVTHYHYQLDPGNQPVPLPARR